MAMLVIPFTWEEAFDKYGFSDGDFAFIGDVVKAEIEAQGYQAEYENIITSHNTVIGSVVNAEGHNYLHVDDGRWWYSRDDVRRLLPDKLVAHLDAVFNETAQMHML
jgi:hypothetical protein